MVKHRRDEGEAASNPALDYLLERLKAQRPGLMMGQRSVRPRRRGAGANSGATLTGAWALLGAGF